MKFPEKGLDKAKILDELKANQKRNWSFGSGRIFGSMCAMPLEVSIRAYTLFIESNLGNPGLYPATAEMEKKVVGMVGDLLHGKKVYGKVLSGGTEANISALWMYRNMARRKEVILPLHAHFSFKKACDLLGLKPVFVKVGGDYTVDIADMKRKISDNTLCAVAVAGSTELGVVDPVPEIGEICAERNLPLHVDAAFGGFVIPFLKACGRKIPDFDFLVKGVTSITVDPHKMGQSVMPSGILLTRENYWKYIEFSAPYLTSEIQSTLLGTRASGAVAGTYAAIKYLGFSGYLEIVRRCMAMTEFTCGIAKHHGIEPVVEPVMNILALRVKNARKVVKALHARQFFVSYGELTDSLRIVLMPYAGKKQIRELFEEGIVPLVQKS
ncbi:MAG: tyrosine decarboxylase MfnA [Thermoplasmata archaeon]|nr:tyrosine decarboxylase MfnA [Thermoplasmata archaeon]